MVCWTVAFGINVAILAHLWQNRWYNEVADLDRQIEAKALESQERMRSIDDYK